GPDPDREGPVVPGGDEMDRSSHQRSLYDGAAVQRTGERGTLEGGEPRPQPDVHRGRVLRLDPADAFEGARDRKGRPLEQELPRQHRSVQLTRRELSHAAAQRHQPRSGSTAASAAWSGRQLAQLAMREAYGGGLRSSP